MGITRDITERVMMEEKHDRERKDLVLPARRRGSTFGGKADSALYEAKKQGRNRVCV